MEDAEIPSELQPRSSDYGFDLDQALRSIVSLKSIVPSDAFTAPILGTERVGSGVMIDRGVVLTIGFLVTEAETVWLTTADGRAVAGHVLAYDQVTGFGLVQVLGSLDLPIMELGQSGALELGESVMLAAAGGPRHAIRTRVVARQEFAGYWEYHLEDAIFTGPAHPAWAGAALVGRDGRLLGIGYLIIQHADLEGRLINMNMVVPIDHLKPVLGELMTHGRVARPPRPWLGMFARDADAAVVVEGLARGGPAHQAGILPGDHVLAVGGERVDDLASLWQMVWASGDAGVAVTLRVARGESVLDVTVRTVDRASLLRSPKLH